MLDFLNIEQAEPTTTDATQSKKVTLGDKIWAYKKNNPTANQKEIALAVGASGAHVSTTLKLKEKEEAVKIPSQSNVINTQEATIRALRKSCDELAEQVSTLKDDNYLFIKRELKLMGVIDYLESKIKNGSPV